MELNRYIDHTLLSPNVMDVAFEDLLSSAIKHNFYSVCVSPYIAERVVQSLKDYPDIKVGTVVAFPHGNLPLYFKLDQIDYFRKSEAKVDEIDWVLNVGEVYNENWEELDLEMWMIANRCKESGIVSKCIVETGAVVSKRLLTELFFLVKKNEIDFIKTSTGFNGEGAQVEHIKMWNELRAGAEYPKIKASGGIKSAEKALALIEAGADRLGTSSAVEVIEQYERTTAFTKREGYF